MNVALSVSNIPILSALNSANQKLPSGPLTMPAGAELAVMPVEKSVTPV